MDLTDIVLKLTATGSLGRTVPRAGGRAPFGLNEVLKLAGSNAGWVSEFIFGGVGDWVEILLTTGLFDEGQGADGMTITGTTSPSATGSLLPAGTIDGKPAYSTDGWLTPPATGIWVKLVWEASPGRWSLQRYNNGALTGTWRSNSAVATPDLASGWAAVGPATGAPVVTEQARIVVIPPGPPSGGKDPEGKSSPLSEVHTLIIMATGEDGELTEGLTIAHNGSTLPNNPLTVLSNPRNGYDWTAAVLRLTAVVPATTVKLLAFGLNEP